MKLFVHHINANDKSLHILKNEEMFRRLGVDVHEGYDRELLQGDLKEYDAVYLNWFENIDGGAAWMPPLRYARRMLQLGRIRRAGLKVIFCKHNRFPHNVRYPALSRSLYLSLCKRGDVIIAFNADAEKDLREIFPDADFSAKLRVIPPLNYIGAYPENPAAPVYGQAKRFEGMMIVGYAGKISPYKNVELILRAASALPEIGFLICGKPSSEDYRVKLENLAAGLPNVVTRFETVPDDEMQPLLDVSDLLVMPYDKKSAANSGTGRMAFSYARTVVTPDIASMNLIPEDLIYKYHYDRGEEHFDRLLETLRRAHADWKRDPGILREKGEKLRHLMETDYSEEAIARKYQEIFRELTGGVR